MRLILAIGWSLAVHFVPMIPSLLSALAVTAPVASGQAVDPAVLEQVRQAVGYSALSDLAPGVALEGAARFLGVDLRFSFLFDHEGRFVENLDGRLSSSAAGASLNEYLKIRSKYGISQAAGAEALETLVGTGTIEVRATVKGVMTVDDRTTLLIALPGSQTLSIGAEGAPPWLRVPNTTARLIVQASRENEFAELNAKLIAAIEEGTIRAWEEEQRRKAEAAAKARENKPQTTRGNSARNWNLPPHEAIPVYAKFIRGYNPRLTEQQAQEIAHGIIGFSIQFGVDARLITAMVLVESGFNPSATSPKGAMGLGQLMPGTAQGLGVRNAYDTYENLFGTVRLIRGHLDKYAATGPDGQKYADLVTALAAYNAGSGAVRKYGGVPPYRETQNYIRKVIDWYRRLCGAN